jgi:hypothetical protein
VLSTPEDLLTDGGQRAVILCYAVAGGPYLAKGEAAIVRSLGMDFGIVARLKRDAWRELEP